MNIAGIARAARAAGAPHDLVAELPYLGALGISVRLEDERLVSQLAFDQHLIGDLGAAALHAGAVTTLLESTALVSLLWNIENIAMPELMTSSVEFLASGRPKTTFARAEIVRHGHQIANVRTIAWQDEETAPIAAAHAHVRLVEAR